MIIREMNATFGTLENRQLKLSDGLNIIEGPNESGKSTWCAFIRAMLYGVNSSERDTKTTLAIKNRYKPWSGSPMSGTMKLQSHLGEITLVRKGSPAAPMRDFMALGLSGDRIPLSESAAGEALLGIGQETFERSAFIDHPEIPAGNGGELERRILSLVTAGEEGASYSAAESRLREWQRRLRFNRKSGEIPALEDRLLQLRAASDAVRNKAEDLANKSIQIRELEAERRFLLGEISAHKAAEKTAAAERLRAAEARLTAAEKDLSDTAKMLPPGGPAAEELRRLEREVYAENDRRRLAEVQTALFTEKHRQIEQAEQQIRMFKPFCGCSSAEAKETVRNEKEKLQSVSVKNETGKYLKKSVFFIILPILISAVFFILLPPLYAAAAAVLLIAASAVTAVRISASKAKKHIQTMQQDLLAKYSASDLSEIDRSLTEYDSLYDSLAILRTQESELRLKLDSLTPISETTINRIYEIFPYLKNFADIQVGIQKAVASALSAVDKHSHALMLRNSARSIVEALRSGPDADSTTGANEQLPIPTLPKAEAESRLKINEQKLASLRRETALIEGSMDNEKSPSDLDAEAAMLSARLAALNRGYDALSLALEALSEADRQLRERFSPALNAAAAEIFAAFTGNKYRNVVVNREFAAMTGTGGSDGLHRALELSRGTIDQLYIALRFAVCRIVPPPGFVIPVILDDAFMSFDDSRLAAALDWLYEESKSRQVLLFTCHNRESSYLNGRPGVLIQTVGQC